MRNGFCSFVNDARRFYLEVQVGNQQSGRVSSAQAVLFRGCFSTCLIVDPRPGVFSRFDRFFKFLRFYEGRVMARVTFGIFGPMLRIGVM